MPSEIESATLTDSTNYQTKYIMILLIGLLVQVIVNDVCIDFQSFVW
jgi:hypothetical protein